MKYKSLFILLAISLFSCTANTSPGEIRDEHRSSFNSTREETAAPSADHLNICVLLDLSDRIDPNKYPGTPQQYEKDINIVNALAVSFQSHAKKKWSKSRDHKDKIKIFFHPEPADPSIAAIAQKLQLDLEENAPSAKKKEAYLGMAEQFSSNIKTIYSLAVKSKKFAGANIWRFMKDEVTSKCIESGKEYRNILVILTDGYMYWQYEKRNQKNRFNYIERDVAHLKKFRNHVSLKTIFDKEDYGFIPVQKDLSNLEVLVIGIAPPEKNPEDFDILKKYWYKWFAEMKVKRYDVIKSDLPVNTEKVLKNFLDRND